MGKVKITLIIVLISSMIFCSCKSSNLKTDNKIDFFLNTDISSKIDIPDIGEWLLYRNNTCADWLGIKYHNKYLREPINIIIIDPYSKNSDQAVKKLFHECKVVGYKEEFGHSSGYRGIIDNECYKQIPANKHVAFANKDFFVTNNHGRIIGPAFYDGKYIFIAGFSTERPTIFKGFHHIFVSFNRARNDFSLKLGGSPVYRIEGVVNLKNVINTDAATTADHDGKAVVITAQD